MIFCTVTKDRATCISSVNNNNNKKALHFCFHYIKQKELLWTYYFNESESFSVIIHYYSNLRSVNTSIQSKQRIKLNGEAYHHLRIWACHLKKILNFVAGGCECVPWKPQDLPVCEGRVGEEDSEADRRTLRFC